MKDQESSRATHDQISGSCKDEEVGDAETIADQNDECESKRRAIEVQTSEAACSRTVTEPKIFVQTSEVDLLDDGYRWRKYGQKNVKEILIQEAITNLPARDVMYGNMWKEQLVMQKQS